MGSKREKRKSEKKKFICRSWLFNHGTNLYHTNETQHLKPKPLTQPTMCNASYVSTVNKEKENKDYDAWLDTYQRRFIVWLHKKRKYVTVFKSMLQVT